MHDELTHEQAALLLRTPKWVVSARGRDGVRREQEEIPAQDKFAKREFLLASEDGLHEFRMNAWCSEKRALKLSIHHQADPTHTGLLRVDYNGWHTNPPDILGHLPERFAPYARVHFTPEHPHIHYHVHGYKPMAWAVPLSDDDFPVKSVEGEGKIPEAIAAFGAFISLKTELKPEKRLFG